MRLALASIVVTTAITAGLATAWAGSPFYELTEAQKRKIVVPDIKALTYCVAVRLRRGPRKRGLRVSSRRDRGSGRPGAERPGQAAASRLAKAAEVGFQFHGSNSARRWAG